MQPFPKDQVASVLAEIVREALTQGESIHVPNLGTFSVEHQNSKVERQPDGQVLIKPPCDEVLFTSES